MTPIDKNATLMYALDLWAGMIRNDISEYRRIWYPPASPGLCGKGGKGEEAYEDLESSFEAEVVKAVEGAVKSLTMAQEKALDKHLGATTTWALYAMEQPDLPPAYLAYVNRIVPTMPVVARSRRVTEEMLGEWLAPRYKIDLEEAMQKVWLALVANGSSGA